MQPVEQQALTVELWVFKDTSSAVKHTGVLFREDDGPYYRVDFGYDVDPSTPSTKKLTKQGSSPVIAEVVSQNELESLDFRKAGVFQIEQEEWDQLLQLEADYHIVKWNCRDYVLWVLQSLRSLGSSLPFLLFVMS